MSGYGAGYVNFVQCVFQQLKQLLGNGQHYCGTGYSFV